jgi:hypothetical protein
MSKNIDVPLGKQCLSKVQTFKMDASWVHNRGLRGKAGEDRYKTRFRGCPTRFGGSCPVSLGFPTWCGGSPGPGKLEHPGTAWCWQWFLGDRREEEKGGSSQLTEDWRSMWICGSVYKCKARCQNLIFHRLTAPHKEGPADMKCDA